MEFHGPMRIGQQTTRKVIWVRLILRVPFSVNGLKDNQKENHRFAGFPQKQPERVVTFKDDFSEAALKRRKGGIPIFGSRGHWEKTIDPRQQKEERASLVWSIPLKTTWNQLLRWFLDALAGSRRRPFFSIA